MRQEIDPEFRKWLEQAYPRLVVAVHRLVGKYGPEEDILHDVLVHLIEKRDTIESEEMLVAYAIRLARWRAIDAYRQRLRIGASTNADDLGDTAPSTEASPEAAIVSKDELRHQLERLPPRGRRVMELTLAGQDSEQIGATLGITPATVRSLLRRSRYQLAQAE